MDNGDEQEVHIDAEDVTIQGSRIIINTGWSPRMVLFNTIGTVAGALAGVASLVFSIVALIIALNR